MLLVAFASAHTLSFGGASDTEDACIAFETASDGASEWLFVSTYAGDEYANLLFRTPDLIGPRTTQVPVGATVNSAKLVFAGSIGLSSGYFEMQGHLLAQEWSEADATWDDAGSGRAWDEPGAAGSSRGSMCTALLLEDAVLELSFDVSRCVTAWASGDTNLGLLFVGDDASSGLVTVGSSESAYAPVFSVDFEADDQDGDGWWAGSTDGYDCDDNDADIRPDGVELPGNTKDEDCDGIVAPGEDTGGDTAEDTGDDDTGEDTAEDTDGELAVIDADGDRYDSDYDCDDADGEVYPGHTEWCDERDNDCNGRVDDACVFVNGGDGCACGAAPGAPPMLAALAVLLLLRRRVRA